MTELMDRVKTLMIENRRVTNGHLYTVPSPTSYPYQWFWDSCFNAIILTHFDIPAAKAELRSLCEKQHNSGMIAHVHFWQRHTVLDGAWGTDETSNLVQPPLIAHALWRVYQKDKNKDFLHELYPSLCRYYEYLRKGRDIRGVGLVGIVNPDESGEDNSPRFDHAMDLSHDHNVEQSYQRRFDLFETHRDCNLMATCTSDTFWVEDVSFNAYLVFNLRMLARIAEEIGEQSGAKSHERAAQEVASAMRTHMFDGTVFRSLSGKDASTVVKTDSWSHFTPLIANLYTQQEANLVVEEYLTNEDRFWLEFGVPTVAKNDPAYDPNEPLWGDAWQHPHWRGPIWMPTHWFLYHGLLNYGFRDLAAIIKHKSYKLVETSGFRENFHPETGVGMGSLDFTWGGLVIDMEPDGF